MTCCHPAETTLQYLRRGCACGPAKAMQIAAATVARCHGCLNNSLPPTGCRAVGMSFVMPGKPIIAHLRQVGELSPELQVVLLLRTNHVKHAVSHFRTACGGSNHLIQSWKREGGKSGRIKVPFSWFARGLYVIHRQHEYLISAAKSLAGKRGVAFTITYEEMQLDLSAHILKLLLAIGAVPPLDGWTGASSRLIKVGTEDMQQTLSNFHEIDAALSPKPCLHRMFVSRTPVVFDLDACHDELSALGRNATSNGGGPQAGRLALPPELCHG
mmetsp:Transcript_28896/g.88599  ORF Transcript_28896/g.88599 Transcript_28896/m.88599 type:complete len:271 (-) Transcript_28896:2323-3135(-)